MSQYLDFHVFDIEKMTMTPGGSIILVLSDKNANVDFSRVIIKRV